MQWEWEQIAEVVCSVGQIGPVGPDDDFYDLGFSSINSLELLIQLETLCNATIPDDRFIEARTPRGILQIIHSLDGTLA